MKRKHPIAGFVPEVFPGLSYDENGNVRRCTIIKITDNTIFPPQEAYISCGNNIDVVNRIIIGFVSERTGISTKCIEDHIGVRSDENQYFNLN